MSGFVLFWGFLTLLIFGYSVSLVVGQRAYKTAGVIALLVCLLPIFWVAADCFANSSSEACVWGKAYMPLYLGISILIGAPLGFLVYHFSLKLFSRRG